LTDDCLELEWKEDAGPRVQQPLSRGFGTKSVIASIETQLHGRAIFDWRPEGLCCRLSVPLSEQGQLNHPDHMVPSKPGHGNGETVPFVPVQRWRDAASN
jgi:hypothetical protein